MSVTGYPEVFGLSVPLTGKVVVHELPIDPWVRATFASRRTSGVRRAAQAHILKSPVNWFTPRSIERRYWLPQSFISFSEGERHGLQK